MARLPAECDSKLEIREEIDRIDRELVTLFAERFAFVQRMAEFKTDPDEALVPARVDEVLDRVAGEARRSGFDEQLARELWARLIEWNIDFERDTIARRTAAG